MNNLTSVILKNSKRGNRLKTKKEDALSFLAFLIVFFYIAGIMVAVSIYVTKKLIQINQAYTFVNILLLFNFFILFAKSIFESLNVLYFSKDLKILLRMPIKSINILNAKIIYMIISEYEMELIMLAIPMIIYGLLTHVGVLFYFYMILILLVLPVIPILISSLIIAVIMRFTNFIKNKSKVMYITIFLSIFVLTFITSSFNSIDNFSIQSITEIVLQTNGIAEKISEYFILIKPIMKTLLNYNNINGFRNLILYFVENIITYIVIVYIISNIYLKGAIGASINSNKNTAKNNKQLSLNDFKRKNKSISYIKKEIKILLRTPIFFIQCIIMPIAYPLSMFLIVLVLVGFANFVGLDLWQKLNEISSSTVGIAMFLGIGQVCYMMNFTSIIAISKESKNAIITKYIPINLIKQFKLKTFLGLTTNSISSILVTVFYYMCTKNLIYSIILFIILIQINNIGEKVKLLIDLNKPQITWDNEYTMMKQNTNVMYELFYTLLLGGIILLTGKIINNINLFFTIIFVMFLLLNYFINRYINKNNYKIFSKIY